MQSQNVSTAQKCLLYRLVDKEQELKNTKFMLGGFLSRWEFIAEQLNKLEGPKKSAKEWWLRYQLENKYYATGKACVAKEKIKIQPNMQLSPSSSSTESRTSITEQNEESLNTLVAALNDLNTIDIKSTKVLTTKVRVRSQKKTNAQKCKEYREKQKLQNIRVQNTNRCDVCYEGDQLQIFKKPKTDKERSKSYYDRQKLKKPQIKKTPKTPAQRSKEYREKKKLKQNDLLQKQNTDHLLRSKSKETTMLKLDLLLCADDHTNRLHPSCRMTITDWLLFDTQLVHENFDVIQKKKASEMDHKALLDLFHLVEKYKTECLEGDLLAQAWTALTIEYNSGDRQCTPMLLQRRWYQLKLAAREIMYKFWFMYLESPNDMIRVMKYKPSPLLLSIIRRYSKKVALEPFMSWEDQIKNGLVILREQFVSIAMKSKNTKTPTAQIVTETPELTDLTLTVDEVKQEPFEYSTLDDSICSEAQEHHTSQITKKNEECFFKYDPEESIDSALKEEYNSDVSIEETTLDTMTESDKPEDKEMDTDNYLSNDIPVSDKRIVEMPDPFSEVTGSGEETPVLPKITNVFGNVHVPIEALSKISALATTIAKSNDENQRHINASVIEQNNQIEDLEIDEPGAFDDRNRRDSIVDEKKKEVHIKDKKLHMIPVVNTVKLDDMGLLPMDLMRRVKNKNIIDIINTKSKVTKNKAPKLKCRTNLSLNKVELSSSRFIKSGKRSYSYYQLSKNPDFNIHLKKLNRQFFRSDRNLTLLRACKPLCVDVDKSFESQLENGKMYIKPSTFCESGEAYEQMTSNACQTNVSLQSPDVETGITNTNTKLDLIPITLKPIEVNIPSTPVALASNSSEKFLTVVPLTTKESTATESLLVSNNINATRSLIDLYTLNKLLCLLADLERQQTVQNDVKATTKQNPVIDKGGNDVLDTSEPTVAKTSNEVVNTDKPEIRKGRRPSFKPCCWAQAKVWSISTGRRVLEPHRCDFPSCDCCCKEILAKYYIYHQKPKTTCQSFLFPHRPLSSSGVLKAVDEPKAMDSKAAKQKNEFNELNDWLADVVTTFSDQPLDKFLSLGNNKMLLTTTKFPKNFNLFTRFQYYVDNNLTLPKALRLVLKPSGRVFLKRDIRAEVDPKILKEIIDLVAEFNQLSSVPTTQNTNNKINNDTTPDTSLKESSCMEDTKDNSNPDHNKETPKLIVTEQSKLTLNPISGNPSTTILPAQSKQEPRLQVTKENGAVIDKIKSCLGELVYKTLTPIKLVSELKYAYLQNGLFFKLDIDTGSLVPINVCIKKNRIPIQNWKPMSSNSLSVPKKLKTPIPINTKTLCLVTYNNPESVSSQSPISFLSTSEPISSSLPGENSCKPLESTVSEHCVSVNNGNYDVSDFPYLSDLPFTKKPQESLKVEDTSTVSDDDNAESWNLHDNFLSIDDGTEKSIKRLKESSSTSIDAEVDQIGKVVKVEQILGL